MPYYPMGDFLAYELGADHWAYQNPVPLLTDLERVDYSLPIKLSFLLGFTAHRTSQLIRSLERLCRQDWKEFEVLVCYDGNIERLENVDAVYDQFRPYLRLRTFRIEHIGFSGCASRAIKHLIPKANGEYLAMMQPEMMLKSNGARMLYDGHFTQDGFHIVERCEKPDGQMWVTLKPGILSDYNQKQLDLVNWHHHIEDVEQLGDYRGHFNLNNWKNPEIEAMTDFPYWFAASCHRDASIWKDMPTLLGHPSLDVWLCNYRGVHCYEDAVSKDVLAYHQFHTRANSVQPEGEEDSISMTKIREKLNA